MNKKNKLNKIIEEKKANSLNKKLRYGLRKLSIGVVSCFLGYAIALTPNLSYANTETNSVVTSTQTEKTTKDESKTTQKENKDMLQGKTVPPVGQVDHSDLTTNKVTEKSTIQKASMVNPIEKTEDKVEKMNTQYTVTYGPGLAYVGEGTTVDISFKQNNNKVNVPAGTTFDLAGNSVKGATVDKTTGKISYTPDSQEFKNLDKDKVIEVTVNVKYKDQTTSTATAYITVRKNQNVSKAPSINPVVEGQTKITGTGVKGANITVEIEKKVNEGETAGVTTVKDDGKWEVVVDKDSIKEGYKVRAIQTEKNKTPTATHTTALAKQESEKDKQKPDAGTQNPQDNGAETPQDKSETPTVNPVTEGDTTISGTGKAGAKIHVKSDKGLIIGENIEVNNEGKWTLNIPKGIELKKGDVVLVDQEEGKELPKQINTVVQAKKNEKNPQQKLEKPTINEVTEGDQTISGTGEPGAKVNILKIGNNVTDGVPLARDVDVKEDGKWSATIDATKFKAGDTILAVQKKDGKVSKPTEIKVIGISKKPEINLVKEGDKVITGRGVPGAKIDLGRKYKDSEERDILATDITVDKNGDWKVTIDAKNFKAGDKIYAHQTETDKKISELTEVTVGEADKQSNQPEKPAEPKQPEGEKKPEDNPQENKLSSFPAVNEIKAGDKKVTGKGVPGATIVVTKQGKDGKEVKTTVGEDGKWSVDLNEAAKEGDEFVIQQQEKGKDKSPKILKVTPKSDKKQNPEKKPENNNKPGNNNKPENNPQENKLSSFPVVNDIKAGDKQVTGKGVPGATIVVTKQGENGKEVKATVGEDGKWSVDLNEAAKEGDEFIIKQQEKGKKGSPRISKVTQKSDKKPEGEKKPGDTKKPEDNKNPETKKPDVKKPEAKNPGGEKKPENNKKPEGKNPGGEKKPENNKKPEGKNPGGEKKPENNKKPEGKNPEQNPEVNNPGKKPEGKNPGKTTNPSNNKKQPEKTPEKTPDVKNPDIKTPEMKRPEKNAKKPSTQNKKSMDGLSLHYEIKTVKKGAKIKVTPVFKDKSGNIIKMPQSVIFSLDKNSPKGVKIDPKTGELSVDTTGYKNGDKIVVTVVATIKGSTTKVYSLFAKDGKTNQPNEATKTTEQDTVIKTKVEINIEKSEKNKTNKNNKKASNKKKLPKAGYENEIISLAIAGITTLGGAYITNKKKK